MALGDGIETADCVASEAWLSPNCAPLTNACVACALHWAACSLVAAMGALFVEPKRMPMCARRHGRMQAATDNAACLAGFQLPPWTLNADAVPYSHSGRPLCA